MDDATIRALQRALHHAERYVGRLAGDSVAPTVPLPELRTRLAIALRDEGQDPVRVIDELAAATDGALVRSSGGRFFAWVIGGALPSALAADWLTSTWDQNAALHACAPAAVVAEEVAGEWLKELLDLPRDASFAFTTGCQLAHFTCLAAARHAVLRDAGHDLDEVGLAGAPRVRLLVNERRHHSVDRALKFLGFGRRDVTLLAVDDDGRLRAPTLAAALRAGSGPTIVVLNAGDINTAAIDPFAELVPLAHAERAWVHVDGAFGLIARASATRRALLAGIELANSWATDAHKWLNVPYDCGLAFVRDAAAHRAAMTMRADYVEHHAGVREPMDWTPEWSRRARGFVVYAALRELGRSGLGRLVERCCQHARRLTEGIAALPGAELLHRPELNQGLVRFRDERPGAAPADHDRRTEAVIRAVNATGEAFFSGTSWRQQRAMRISVVNWRTTTEDVERSLEACARAVRPPHSSAGRVGGVLALLLLLLPSLACAAQTIGGGIDGPDGLSDLPAEIGWQDTSPGWSQAGDQLLLTGVIRQPDGTPARDVVLYYYHTNLEGRYLHDPSQPRSMRPNELGQTHGYLRGWVRTGADGRYEIRTLRPGPYPGGDEPAHVHATLEEPGRPAYWIDDFVFDDDPLLTPEKRQRMELRAGSGILRLTRRDGVWVGERDLHLGRNVPGHPAAAAAPRSSRAEIVVQKAIEDGTSPGIALRGLAPRSVVRLHALRTLERWQQDGEEWRTVPQPLHAWADFVADGAGAVQVDSQAPKGGTYPNADPLGLLWSGRRFGDPALASVRTLPAAPADTAARRSVQLTLEQAGELVAQSTFDLVDSLRPIAVSEHSGKGWHAVYARPRDGTALPVVVSLHGSEGGSVAKATGRALPLAARGFAAVALNYFAYPHEAIAGVPQQHAEIRLEILNEVRDWIDTRPEIAPDAIRLIGTSKGAEFALLAATKFDWITHVVAIVPTDVVWEGYSGGGGVGAGRSSWSFAGAGLPFVPLFPFDPTKEGLYRTNTERYERSRAYFAEEAADAFIAIEESQARLLLLASDRDEVWASGAMARTVVERMTFARQADRVQVTIYPRAGHQIAGTGTFPVRLYGVDSLDPEMKELDAEGEAAADAWRRTLRFLAE